MKDAPVKSPMWTSSIRRTPNLGCRMASSPFNLVEDEAELQVLVGPEHREQQMRSATVIRTFRPGMYQVYITDPKAAASCFIKVNITLTMQWSCIDTVYVTIPQNDPSEVCVDPVLDLMGPVVSASLCGFNPSQIDVCSLDPQSGCVPLIPLQILSAHPRFVSSIVMHLSPRSAIRPISSSRSMRLSTRHVRIS